MAILDQFGNSMHVTKLVSASQRYGRDVPFVPNMARDLEELFTACDFRSTLSQSRLLYANCGIARTAIFQKADAVIGRAWEPEFKGENQDWGAKAKEWLRLWYRTCDVRGGIFNFKTNLWLDSVALDRDGDVFIILTESKNGYPQIQHIPAHRIGNRSSQEGEVKKGKYRGRKISNGVIKNDQGRAIAYQVLGKEEKDDEIIDEANIIHILDPEWHDQYRGIPGFSHAIHEIRKAKTSEDWEQMAQMMLSAHALVEYNDTGTPEDDPGLSYQDIPSGDGKLAVQEYAGGLVRHFKSNSGGKIETISHNRPGDMWESFQDRINRSALAGFKWPYELAWKSEGLNGTTIRNIQERSRSTVEDRQDVLETPALRIISWAIAKAIKVGILEPSNDWWRWGFTKPPKMSIDPRNDSKTMADEYKLGIRNQTGILQERGANFEEHTRERCMEIVKRKQIKAEFEQQYGVVIDDRELLMLTPNEQPEQTLTQSQTNDTDQ